MMGNLNATAYSGVSDNGLLSTLGQQFDSAPLHKQMAFPVCCGRISLSYTEH